MGGLAVIARAAGHRVTGCDAGVYPPMSTQLEAEGIELVEGWDPSQLALKPDLFVIGNVVSRGNPLMEAILDAGLPYASGPQWLADHVLAGRQVLAVAGTHGKTTTSSMLAWILERSGRSPGFLIGGVPHGFGVSARLTESPWFVVEADEYDTAFFDKRSKFVHYRPRVAVLNNLEFDHADIFPDLAAIETQVPSLRADGPVARPRRRQRTERRARPRARARLLVAGRTVRRHRRLEDAAARRPGDVRRAARGRRRRDRALVAAGRAQPAERARRDARGTLRRRDDRRGGRRARDVRRREAADGAARHRRRRHRVRRLRPSSDGHRDHDRGAAPEARRVRRLARVADRRRRRAALEHDEARHDEGGVAGEPRRRGPRVRLRCEVGTRRARLGSRRRRSRR